MRSDTSGIPGYVGAVTSPPHATRPTGTWRLGRIGETQVLARPSLLLMGVALVLVLAPRFELSTANEYLVALALVLGLYASVFVHELAHLVVARAYGMRAPSITLHLLGGETVIEGESRTPAQELWTAVVGPLVSGALALVAWLGSEALGSGLAAGLLWSLAWVNAIVAVFNLVPGLPLDGGRVMRAVVWAVTGRESTGIRVAAWIGRLAAVGVVAAVLVLRERLGTGWLVDLALAVLIGFVLWTGASEALRQADRVGRVNRLVASELLEPAAPGVEPPQDLPVLPDGLHGTMLLRAMAARPAPTYAVVTSEGRLVGLLHADAVDDAYRRTR